jgi:Alpha/beta hydrolase domain
MRAETRRPRRYLAPAIAALAAAIGWASPSDARVQQLVIDSTSTATYTPVGGSPTSYTIYSGRVFGELNPHGRHNRIIQDIDLAPTTKGKVSYISNFEIVTPTDPSQRTGMMIYEVPNRGGSAISTTALQPGVTYVQSGWQGDLLTQCTAAPVPLYPCTDLNAGPYGTPRNGNTPPNGPQTAFVIQVPVATADGNPLNGRNTITGKVYGHIQINANRQTAQLVIFGSAWVPYQPAGYNPANPSSLNTSGAQFWSLTSQTTDGVDGPKTPITNWTWANCPNGPPGTPNPYFICLGNGTFDPNLLYEMVFTAQNPLVLGVGLAATRDLISFLRYEPTDQEGHANPIAGGVRKVMSVGSSQSGSFIRGSIFWGFNEDSRGRIIVDGAWPQIDGRMMWINERWAQENVIPNLYMAGDEAPVWWADFPDFARHLPPNGLLHRCAESRTCPQILETSGSNEFYDEKMGPDFTGFCVICVFDIPKPANVHRYYLPGTSHGGNITAGSFNWSPPPTTPVSTSQTYLSNPNGENFTNNALLVDFIDLLMKNRPMPPSIPGVTYPTLAGGQLVPPTAHDVRFPNIPGFPYGGNQAWPPFVFNFGPRVDYSDQSGVPTIQPPIIEKVLTEYVPHVNSDGNEDVGSVPSVLFQAPIGTYVGWNIIPPGTFYAGQQVQLAGGYLPFRLTQADRTAANDPRPSLEERYGTHAGYVCVVTAAANKDIKQGFLLVADAQTLIANAAGSNVLASPFAPTAADTNRASELCAKPDAQALSATGRLQ